MSKIEELLKNPPKKDIELCKCFYSHGYLTTEGSSCGFCGKHYPMNKTEIDYPAWTSAIYDHFKELVGEEKEPLIFTVERSDNSGVVSPQIVYSLADDLKKKSFLNDIYKTEGYNQAKSEILQKIEKERE